MAKDFYHETVKQALINDGWAITNDPLTLLSKEEGGLETDLGAEKFIAAEKGLKKIGVEVKSFIQPSIMYDFHQAAGQYILYLSALEIKKSERVMYVAIPDEIYYRLIKKEVIVHAIEKLSMKIILYNPVATQIISWKE